MGANGHNAAQVVLEDAGAGGGRAPAPRRRVGTRPWQERATARVMATRAGRWVGYQAARQPALRKVTAYAAKVRR